MHSAHFSKKFPAAFAPAIGCCSLLLTFASDVAAQPTCPCTELQPFGSCLEKKASYPDVFPGAAVVVPPQGRQPALLYVADLFNGFTYKVDAQRLDTAKPLSFASPRGSNATTGLTFRQVGAEVTLFWAIEEKIYSTDVNGGNLKEHGTVQMDRLAILLGDITGDPTIQKGTLGGITNHGSRGTLWGVDIVNDVYFELRDNGELTLEDGKPSYFFNPKRNKLTGGAYGNSIAYAESGGREYFDIPVGALADKRPTEIHRIHASDGAAPETFRVGDPTGVIYSLETALGSPKFVTGIAFWPNSCAAGQSSEIVLDLDTIGGQPKILQVSADEPDSANVTSFECVSGAATEVTLTWRKTRPYTSLKITRQLLTVSGSPAVTVFEHADFANDPQRFVDTGVLDGSYEYVATVTALSTVSPVSCRVTLGVGSLVAFRRFKGRGDTLDPVPFAIAVAGTDAVIVADLNTGDAETFDLNLNPTGTIDGPASSGLTVGLAWNSDSNQLYWVENDDGHHLLHVTDLTGQRVGTAATVSSPQSLTQGIQLGDISYDTAANYFWTVDILNGVIYGVTPLGAIPAELNTRQIPNPEPNGLLSGGIAVTAAADQSITLDIPLGNQSAGVVDQIGRFEYPRGTFTPKKEIRRLDLRSTTGASDFGGIEIAEKGTDKFEFVVGLDTRAIYKLLLSSETSGLLMFRRGDVNNDGALNISDPSALLSSLFKGGNAPPCLAAADADGSSEVDISDAVYLFNYLFKAGPPPAAPFPACGIDFRSPLACASATCVDA